MTNYTVLPFSTTHYPLLNKLFLAAFGTPLHKAVFDKKYRTEDLGHPVIGFLAVHTATQTPAAFYGVFPLTVLLDGKKMLAAQSGDTMTHPAHQRKGLFVLLATKTYAACREAGVHLVFGQPNQNSYHGLVNKLQFRPLDTIVCYDLKLQTKTFPLAKLAQRTGVFGSYLRYAQLVLRRLAVQQPQDFTNHLHTTDGKVLRDAAYLQFKSEAGKFFIRVGDAIVWVKLTDVFWIGEINRYEAVTPETLKQIRQIAFRLGYNTIRFHLNKRAGVPHFLQHFRAQEAEASCFLSLSDGVEPRNFVLTAADFDTW